jgi:hypothetical protein
MRCLRSKYGWSEAEPNTRYYTKLGGGARYSVFLRKSSTFFLFFSKLEYLLENN